MVNTPVASGTKAQKIASSAMPAGEAIFVLQDLAVEGNQPYTFSGQYYIEQLANAKVLHYLLFYDASGVNVGGTTIERTTAHPG
ncbi:hypothetical protein, partial [Paenibacillus periandrae]|uniref:hypothetical protein n=1 Tax=Paenibacillus periandrae TaxID=1761741 RepID=UPI001F08B759